MDCQVETRRTGVALHGAGFGRFLDPRKRRLVQSDNRSRRWGEPVPRYGAGMSSASAEQEEMQMKI
jgi:hypothetical protein